MDEKEVAARARSDGYIECQECGHTLEYNHDRTGCTSDGCGCREVWSRAALRQLRQSYGLPASWPKHLHF